MPGLDVIGAGEPMVPGISMGHNGTAAFGLTIFGADQEDIYVYQTNVDDPDLYAYHKGEERVRTIEESISVKGCPDQTVALKFTRHGPLLFQDAENNRAFALRTVWMDAGMAPYMASLSIMRSTSYVEYSDALARWGCPSVNHIYADTSNTIARKPSGATPVRSNWDGLLPVPGDGRYEWGGYLPPQAGPYAINPTHGFVATANAMNVPDDWSRSNPAIGYEWLDSSRHDTLHRELSRSEPISLADCVRLQCSTFSPIARRVLACLSTMPAVTELPVWRLLQDWDGDLAPGSAASAFFEVWFSKHLGPLAARVEGATPQIVPLLFPFDAPSIVVWLEGVHGDTQMSEQIVQSLNDGFAECEVIMGADPERWSWGLIHKLHLQHPLARTDRRKLVLAANRSRREQFDAQLCQLQACGFFRSGRPISSHGDRRRGLG